MTAAAGGTIITWLLWDRALEVELPAAFRALLDDGDRAQVDRFGPVFKKRETTVGRVLVRTALSAATGIAPAALRFDRGEHGRPFTTTPGTEGVCFNLTHTAGLVACAVSTEGEVGVDAERVAPRSPGLVKRFYHPTEVAYVAEAPANEQDHRTTAVWTLKEAVIKATGKGLAVPLPSFAVNPRTEPPTMSVPPGDDPADRYALWLQWPTPEHALALALRGSVAEVRPVLRRTTLYELAMRALGHM